VPLAGTDYIPGVSEERALNRIETLLDRYLANPVDELPVVPETAAAGGPDAIEERR
jgi:hypothetical protein